MKKLHLFDVDINFKRVIKIIETLRYWGSDDIPHLHGKVKILELEDVWSDHGPHIDAFDLEKIQGVEKIVWEILKVESWITDHEDFMKARCEEIREKLIEAVGTSFKTFWGLHDTESDFKQLQVFR